LSFIFCLLHLIYISKLIYILYSIRKANVGANIIKYKNK